MTLETAKINTDKILNLNISCVSPLASYKLGKCKTATREPCLILVWKRGGHPVLPCWVSNADKEMGVANSGGWQIDW